MKSPVHYVTKLSNMDAMSSNVWVSLPEIQYVVADK